MGPGDPRDLTELPTARHRALSNGQAQVWLLSEILSSEAEGENRSPMAAATGGWGLKLTEVVGWVGKGCVTDRDTA